MAGVDGSGDFPSFSYADSFVYVATASGTVCRPTPPGIGGAAVLGPNLQLTWLPRGSGKSQRAVVRALKRLQGNPFRKLDAITKSWVRRVEVAPACLAFSMIWFYRLRILPIAGSTADRRRVGCRIKDLDSEPPCRYVMMDTCPFLLLKQSGSLFFEHLKRLCCVRGRNSNWECSPLANPSPSFHGVDRKFGKRHWRYGKTWEHWYLRLPWKIMMIGILMVSSKNVKSPFGSVSYLLRLYLIPDDELDMDMNVEGTLSWGCSCRSKMFEELGVGHDQRSYGYPFQSKPGMTGPVSQSRKTGP